MRIEGLEVQRPRAVRIRARVELRREGGTMDELRCRPRHGINQIQVTRRTVTGHEQKPRGSHGQNIFRDDEVAYVSESLLVATIRRRREVRILSNDQRRDAAAQGNDGKDQPTIQ